MTRAKMSETQQRAGLCLAPSRSIGSVCEHQPGERPGAWPGAVSQHGGPVPRCAAKLPLPAQLEFPFLPAVGEVCL